MKTRIIAGIVAAAFVFTQCGLGLAASIYKEAPQNLRESNIGQNEDNAAAVGNELKVKAASTGLMTRRQFLTAAGGGALIGVGGELLLEKVQHEKTAQKSLDAVQGALSENRIKGMVEKVTLTAKPWGYSHVVTVSNLVDGSVRYNSVLGSKENEPAADWPVMAKQPDGTFKRLYPSGGGLDLFIPKSKDFPSLIPVNIIIEIGKTDNLFGLIIEGQDVIKEGKLVTNVLEIPVSRTLDNKPFISADVVLEGGLKFVNGKWEGVWNPNYSFIIKEAIVVYPVPARATGAAAGAVILRNGTKEPREAIISFIMALSALKQSNQAAFEDFVTKVRKGEVSENEDLERTLKILNSQSTLQQFALNVVESAVVVDEGGKMELVSPVRAAYKRGLVIADSQDEAIAAKQGFLDLKMGFLKENIVTAATQDNIGEIVHKNEEFDFIVNLAKPNTFNLTGLPAASLIITDISDIAALRVEIEEWL